MCLLEAWRACAGMENGYCVIRRMTYRSNVYAKRNGRGGRTLSGQMTCLRQLGSGEGAMPIAAVAGEVRLYRVIDRRDGGNEQCEQPYDTNDAGESKAFPWHA